MAIDGRLIDLGVAAKGDLRVDRIERNFGGKGVEAAAAQVGELVDQHLTDGAQFALLPGPPQVPFGGIAAAVAEHGEVHLDQLEPGEVG